MSKLERKRVIEPPLLNCIKAKITTEIDRRYTRALYESLQPEVIKPSGVATLKILPSQQALSLMINAKAPSEIRASISSYLRLIKAVKETLKSIE
jgi:tRNA threonylcarbamoyladenosine modification (KEOPS) complex  Pcc1 subunit